LIQQQRKPVTFSRGASLVMLLPAIVGVANLEAQADGGAVQFGKSAGPFVITVFTTPTPLRAGPVDISLMIQSRENQQPVLDCQTLVQLHKEGAMSISAEATHETAHNKLFYGAQVKIPEPGPWELDVAIKQGDVSIDVAGEIIIASAKPVFLVYWRSLAVPPLIISLFAMNQWLKRRNRQGR
jgi:hypothetical protein